MSLKLACGSWEVQAKTCHYFLSNLNKDKCVLLVLALRLACILWECHMNAEEQEEPILWLSTRSFWRKDRGKWKVVASFTRHPRLCMRDHRGSFLLTGVWTTRCWRGGNGPVESFQVAATWLPAKWVIQHSRSSSWHLPFNKRGQNKDLCCLWATMLTRYARGNNRTRGKWEELPWSLLVFIPGPQSLLL